MSRAPSTEKTTVDRPANVSRRDFLKLCSAVAAVLSIDTRSVVAALSSSSRPPVLWLHFAECTGCTESTLRTIQPFFDQLILGSISLDYHETIMAGSGAVVHEHLLAEATQSSGQFFCVVEGSIPTKDNGVYGMVGGRTMLSLAQEICPKAKAIICIGTCASYGGLPAASPNPTGAKGLTDALPGLTVPVVNVPGCPPNPVNFIAVIVNYLLKGTLPALDGSGRPTDSYGRLNHDVCPYLHTTRCLESKGCKGPVCYNNCTTVKFNDGTSFPMQASHTCIACSEPNFWDVHSPFYATHNIAEVRDWHRPLLRGAGKEIPLEVYDVAGRRMDNVGIHRGALVPLNGTRLTPGTYLVRDKRGFTTRIKL
jgi:[NiFe] hydrogenase small subunit